MYIVAMFDIFNQKKLSAKLSMESNHAIYERMVDGGADLEYCSFFILN